MNFYTLAAKINRKIDKETSKFRQGQDLDVHDVNVVTYKDTLTKIELSEFEKNARLGIELMLKFKEIAADEGLIHYEAVRNYWFITIRPNSNLVTFKDFKDIVFKFVKRSCFVEYTLSFEQKGVSMETLGNGFHVHIIAKMKQRSKGEVLRDTKSTFKNCTAPNCIEVLLCKNPETLIQGYLIDYESNDEHKIVTKDWDTIWRKNENIEDIYKSTTCLIKSD